MSASDHTQIRKFHDLLGHFRTAMLVTHTHAGDLRARPMAIAHIDDDCRVWFFTSLASGKIHEIESDTHVSLVCQKEHQLYLSLSGIARLTHDRARVEAYWKEPFKVWFPGGVTDPDLALMSIEPETGEYWDEEGFKKIKYLFEAARAYATGTTPHIEEGEQHAKVHLQ